MIAVDNGPDRMIYAGSVLSHYEFEEPGTIRLTGVQPQWKTTVQSGGQPPPPDCDQIATGSGTDHRSAWDSINRRQERFLLRWRNFFAGACFPLIYPDVQAERLV